MLFVSFQSLRRISYALPLAFVLFVAEPATAGERPLRVLLIESFPSLFSVSADGKMTGLMVDFSQALCESMRAKCEYRVVHIEDVVDTLAADKADFAAVTLLATPERQAKVLFSKPFYRSLSIWLAKPSVPPGAPNVSVAVVRGSVQAKYAEMHGWKILQFATHHELTQAMADASAGAALVPMLTAIMLTSDKHIQALGLQSTFMSDPMLGGDVRLSINPRLPELKLQLDAAIDQVKSDGRFDRINTKYLPFRLQ
jgi:polar amino acid transport system substrate-binding protein